jgi:hypothetical protein
MRWLLLGYMFLYIHRPFEIWPVLAEVRLELVYMLVTGALWLVAARKCWIPHGLHWAFVIFAAAVIVCWVASPWNNIIRPDLENYLKIFPCYLLFVTLLHEERHLEVILLGMLVIMAGYMGHSLYEYASGRHLDRMNITRLMGIDSNAGDPNHFGLAIICALPFVVPVWVAYRHLLVRGFLVGYVGLTLVCIALSGSRAAFCGLLLCAGVLIWRSRWRWPMAGLAVLSAPVMWAALPTQMQNRFETIIHPEVGPKSAKDSGDDRMVGLQLGAKLWAEYPLTGCGPGMWIPATGRKIQSHNLYGQVAGEMGTLGVVTFAGVLGTFWVVLRRLRREYRQHPKWGRDSTYHVIGAVGLGLLLMLFFGNASHNLFRHQWLWFGAFLIVADACVRRRLAACEVPSVEYSWAPDHSRVMAPAAF